MKTLHLNSSVLLLLCLSLSNCRTSQLPERNSELEAFDRNELSLSYLGLPIEAIDMHMHPGRFETMGPLGQNFLRKVLPDFLPTPLKDLSLSASGALMLDPYGAFIGIKRECERAGMTRCGLMSIYAPDAWGVTTREELLGYLNDDRNQNRNGEGPYFFGLAGVRMQNWASIEASELESLRKTLKHPLVKAIKLAFIHNSIPLDDARYDSIYQVAEDFDVPVYHHVGSSPLRKLTDVSLEEQDEYLASVLDTIKKKGMIERTIYGSDGPGSPGGTQKYIIAVLASLKRVGYSFQEADLILSKNSVKLFKL
ncbi:MAG: hypothetical protein NTX25_03215 [Proteobacteria bacterium]|nr:hypothetical protein [Pseudomonadota bacterium]